MMMTYNKGDIVLSLAGRDAKKAFVVVEEKGEDYVGLADGKSRKAEKPKKKKTKHIRLIKKAESESAMSNADLRKMLKAAETKQEK